MAHLRLTHQPVDTDFLFIYKYITSQLGVVILTGMARDRRTDVVHRAQRTTSPNKSSNQLLDLQPLAWK